MEENSKKYIPICPKCGEPLKKTALKRDTDFWNLKPAQELWVCSTGFPGHEIWRNIELPEAPEKYSYSSSS